MNRTEKGACDGSAATPVTISRRVAVASAASTLLCVLAGSRLGRAQGNNDGPGNLPKEPRERIQQSQAFAERMRNATSAEERRSIMQERMAADRRRAIEHLREQLSIPEAEWAVIRPRLEAVYNLRHPVPQPGPGNEAKRPEVQQKSARGKGSVLGFQY